MDSKTQTPFGHTLSIMKTAWAAVALLVSSGYASAQVKFEREADRVRIEIGGKPYSDLFIGKEYAKPFLHPLRAASGTIVSRQFPMVAGVEGESHDHPHQRGLFFAHENVNGTDFWNNEFTYKTPNRGVIVFDKIEEMKNGKRSGTLRVSFDWKDPRGTVLLTEDRTMVFYDGAKNRVIDFDVTLTAVGGEVTMGDAKDGGFGIRVADAMKEDKGGIMVNAEGGRGEKNVWGKPSNWVDYSGEIGGEKVGIAIFDNPANPNHPNRWHSRAYGLFAVNPFGNHVFDPAAPVRPIPLARGASLRFRWRVVVHPGDAESAGIAALWARYATGK